MQSSFSIKEALRFGWEKTKSNFPLVFTVVLVMVLINLSSKFLDMTFGFDDHNADFDIGSLMLSIFTQIAILIIELILSINIIKQGLIIVRGGEANLRRLFDYPDNFFWFVLGQILTGIIIVIGLLLLIVPGIIAALAFFFVKPLLVDQKLRPMQAIRLSYAMTNGRKWQFLKFSVVLLLVNLVGLLALGVGLIATLPMSFFAFLYVYNNSLVAYATPKPAPEVAPVPENQNETAGGAPSNENTA
jgi:uncharacterized membrane protein